MKKLAAYQTVVDLIGSEMCVDKVLARYKQVIFFCKNRTHMAITNPTLEIARFKYAPTKCDIKQ